jgi:hypothetical protein
MFVYDGLPSARLPLSIKDSVSDVCALAPAEGVIIATKVKDTRNNDFIIFVLPILHQDCSIFVPMTRAYPEPVDHHDIVINRILERLTAREAMAGGLKATIVPLNKAR